MKPTDGFRGLGFGREGDEGKPARATGDAVGREKDVHDLPRFRQQVRDRLGWGLNAQVSDEDLGGDGRAPLSR